MRGINPPNLENIMTIELYNPNVPRILIAEATRTLHDNTTKPTFLVTAVFLDVFLDWIRCVDTVLPGHIGADFVKVPHRWGGININPPRSVDFHLDHEMHIKFESPSGLLETLWFDMTALGNVFAVPATPHVVLGNKKFIETTGAKVVRRLQDESAEYARIVRDLAVRDESDDWTLGPFITNLKSTLTF